MRRFGWICLVLAGCGSGSGSKDTADQTETPGTNDSATTEDPDADLSAQLQGLVTGPSGPLANANIRFCRGAECRYFTTEADGTYAFSDVLVAWHSLEIVPPPGSGLATAFAALEFQTDQSRTVDISIPALDSPQALGARKELELGSGLLVTVGADDLEPPLFVDPATEAAGVQVPEAQWPPIDRPGEVLALWYTVPFDHTAVPAEGLPVRIENQWDLPKGQTYQIWVASYRDSAWLDAGTLTVGADGYLTGDAALPLLSTVALVEE